jgi:hypothetical protein
MLFAVPGKEETAKLCPHHVPLVLGLTFAFAFSAFSRPAAFGPVAILPP